jgi:hypothetical protein
MYSSPCVPLSFFDLTPNPSPRERGYDINIEIYTPFSPGRRGQGDEVDHHGGRGMST